MLNRLKTLVLILFPTSLILLSCGDDSKKQLDATAEAFANEYFNWRYSEAMPYVTAESSEYIKFLATNVTEDDVQLLRSMESGAEITIENCDVADGDSVAYVDVTVDNFCHADTIGKPAKLHESAKVTLMLMRRGDKWQVVVSNDWPKMAFPQQSETQDHD